MALIIPLLGGFAIAACGSGGKQESAAPGSSPVASCVSGSVAASGSTALQPLVQKAAEIYRSTCPGATINVSGGGSSAGLSNVSSGTSDIGDSDVPVSRAKGIDASSVVDHQVALVVFAVGVNPQAGVTSLTTGQVRDVFSGRITNWSQAGGGNVPVTLIERKPGSGTRLAFDRIIMKDRTESGTPASTQDSTQLVLQQLSGSPGAVSYLSLASLKPGAGAIAVSLDGVVPGSASISDGTYPYYSHEHMYTRAGAGGLALSFVNLVLSRSFQDDQVTRLGYLPVSTTTRPSAAD